MKRITTIPPVPPRPDDAHKGTFGKVLVIAGSRGMSGAAALAGLGALRGGAGLVTVAVPQGILPIVAGIEPSYLTMPLPDDDQGHLCNDARDSLERILSQQTSIAIGPGIGQSASLSSLVSWLFSKIQAAAVFDADALNLLASSRAALFARKRQTQGAAPRILTPHPGEFARLAELDTVSVQRNRERLAIQFAREHHVVLVLKGHDSVVTDGNRVAINSTGNSGMATGGSGDVLTGLIAALIAQGMAPFEAAQLGAYLHGLAGDLAAKELSKPALIASDLPRWLGEAFRKTGKHRSKK